MDPRLFDTKEYNHGVLHALLIALDTAECCSILSTTPCTSKQQMHFWTIRANAWWLKLSVLDQNIRVG